MKLDARTLAPALAAALIFALILTQTLDALQLSGAWQKASAAAATAPSPFEGIERELARAPGAPSSVERDPLREPSSSVVVAVGPQRPSRPSVPAAPRSPVLTSIVFDADPRATLRWEGRDYSVRAGALFAEFRVLSISRDQVVLDRGGESLVLRLPQRGDQP